MLTRLRVQGFKNLLDVDLRFGPFTCITGPNAVGKSNVFDAIHFLHLLTQFPIMEAVRRVRESKGRSPDPASLFTAIGSYRAPLMRFTADLLVEPEVEDEFGVAAKAAISALEYTVAFRLGAEDGVERLELSEESLRPVSQEKAKKALGFPASEAFRRSAIKGRRSASFISTLDNVKVREIQVHQEGHGGRKVPAPKSSLTVIGGMATSDFPTVLAAHREMQSWRTLLLEPSAMRAPSLYSDPRSIDARGANLPGAIMRLARTEGVNGQVFSGLANRLASLVDEVQDLRVKDDEKTETLTLEVGGRDHIFHPARSLSDGTLRFLVLATLSMDPEARGLICLEEPENGIHPARIEAMVRLLRDIAVDPQSAVGDDNPLRQVIVNTHSPKVVGEVLKEGRAEDLVYLEEKSVAAGGQRGKAAVVRVPPKAWRARVQKDALPVGRGHLAPYLEAVDRGQLEMSFD